MALSLWLVTPWFPIWKTKKKTGLSFNTWKCSRKQYTVFTQPSELWLKLDIFRKEQERNKIKLTDLYWRNWRRSKRICNSWGLRLIQWWAEMTECCGGSTNSKKTIEKNNKHVNNLVIFIFHSILTVKVKHV